MPSTRSGAAALGVTVKSGWACAVLIAGSVDEPEVVDCRRIELSDPDIPESRQPYHDGFGTARASGRELTRLVASVKRFGGKSVADLIEGFQSGGHRLRGVGAVVGSLIDPATLGNSHVRIHALEGQLFRGVVQDAAAERRLACSIWRERDLYALAARHLEQSETRLRSRLTAWGKTIDGPWRAEQKAASLAAWLVLAGIRSSLILPQRDHRIDGRGPARRNP